MVEPVSLERVTGALPVINQGMGIPIVMTTAQAVIRGVTSSPNTPQGTDCWKKPDTGQNWSDRVRHWSKMI